MYRNQFKSGYIFLRLFFKNRPFRATLLYLLNKWKSSYQKQPLGYFHECKNYEEVRIKNKIAYSQRLKFIKSLNKNELLGLERDINKFLNAFNLGREWFLTITDYIISLWLSPPIYNLDIRDKNKRVMLILNPDTSVEDIEDAYWFIKERQKKLWPNFKRPNFSMKSFRNIFIMFRDLEEKFNNKSNEYYDTTTDEWGEQKINDKAIVAKIFENEDDINEKTDKKRVANLRQARHRFWQKTM